MENFAPLVLARRLARDGSGRATRERSGLSIRELARVIGVDVATLSRWERGEARPRGEAALQWLEACKAIERLLGGPDPSVAAAQGSPPTLHSESSHSETPPDSSDGAADPHLPQFKVRPSVAPGCDLIDEDSAGGSPH